MTATVTDITALTGSQLTMTSREISELLGSRHDKVRQSIDRLAARGVIQSPPMGNFKNINGVETLQYIFSGEQGKRDSIVVVAQLSPEFTARLVDCWQELEVKQKKQIPDFSNPAEAARAWAKAYEEKQEALAERDHAVQTKAETGSRREATAMATASLEKRRADAVQREFDIYRDASESHQTILAFCTSIGLMPDSKTKQQMGKRAAKFCREYEIEAKTVPDARYGSVKSYPVDALKRLFAREPA